MTHYQFDLPGEPITEFHTSGVRSCVLASGRGEMHTYHLTFEPGSSIGTHTAGFDQLFFVLEGTAWVDIDGRRVELRQHEATVVNLGDIHSKGSTTGARVLMVQVASLESPRE
jgi:mannose-6-phosphate isomerase-like protein (cupin superfamily)